MSAAPRRGNLPAATTALVGRAVLLPEVVDLVRANPLVTLSGVGGVGKTRLALAVAAELADEFPDGVWFVELASVGDPASVPEAIATALGVPPQGDADVIDTVAAALAGRRLLLVVDNCEHVQSAATSAIARIIARTGSAKVLATSREYLWTAGEALLAVSPLTLEGGVASDAVTLFVERARTVRPGFGVAEPETAAAVIEICAALDGLPLGIELAAARMAAMSAVEVRDRLDSRFRLLTGPEHGPERQSTLGRAVDWSYDLLTEDDRELLRIASVFAGGFDLPSICAVAGAADEVAILSGLDSLVRKSLVVADHAGPRTRYRLFETVRQYAENALSEAGVRGLMRDRHAAHFGRDAATRWESWNGPGWRDTVDWVEIELANLRAAFRWSAANGDLVVATDIAAHAALMGVSIELFETIGWAEELLDAAAAADVPRLPRLYTAAGQACFVGRAEVAAANAHRATELEAQGGYQPCPPGYAMFVEALAQVYCGHLDRYLDLTGAVAQLSGPSRAYGIAAYVDGLQSAGRVEEALLLTEDAVAAAREVGSPYWIAYTLWIVGLAFSATDAQRALSAWDEGVEFVGEHGVGFFTGFLARDAARLHTSDGEVAAALDLFATAVDAFSAAGTVSQLVITLASVPALFDRLDRLDAAATLLGAMSREPGSAHHVPELVDLESRVAERLGVERAARLTARGTSMDLTDAVAFAVQQIELARRELAPEADAARPWGLTRRELQVLRALADGATTREISEQLFISSKTADHHIQHIYTKIGVSNRATATRWALEHAVLGSGATG